LEHLELLHFFCAGNKALQALLLQLRAPNLTTFDAKVNSADDAYFLEECGSLLAPVTNLRIYGIHSSAKMMTSLMDMMPSVTNIDLTTTAHSLAACLSVYGRGWRSMSRMRLEDPAFRDVERIMGTMKVGILQIYYPMTLRRMRRTQETWVRRRVSVLECSDEAEHCWYSSCQ
jgi:hypothetical protein